MNHAKLMILIGVFTVFGMTRWVSAQGRGQQQGGQARPMMQCQERFSAMDINEDGKVTKEEFMAQDHRGGRSEDVFKSRDSNGDGVLTQDEFCSGKGMGRGMGNGKKPTT